jgi:hypothetical protein
MEKTQLLLRRQQASAEMGFQGDLLGKATTRRSSSHAALMRYLTRTCKRCVPIGGFQNQLEANGDLAADAKMERRKR